MLGRASWMRLPDIVGVELLPVMKDDILAQLEFDSDGIDLPPRLRDGRHALAQLGEVPVVQGDQQHRRRGGHRRVALPALDHADLALRHVVHLVVDDAHLRAGLNVAMGKVTCRPVAALRP